MGIDWYGVLDLAQTFLLVGILSLYFSKVPNDSDGCVIFQNESFRTFTTVLSEENDTQELKGV